MFFSPCFLFLTSPSANHQCSLSGSHVNTLECLVVKPDITYSMYGTWLLVMLAQAFWDCEIQEQLLHWGSSTCLPNEGKIWRNSVTLRFCPCHFAQHAIFRTAWFFSLFTLRFFRVLSQMLVAGTATPVCWTAAAPIKTRSWWAKCSAAATVDAAGLMDRRQRCAPSLEQVGVCYGS